MKKISVSIVTYNNENEIRDVLNSIEKSDCIDDIDIFVIDNCSKDKTLEIVRNEYPNVRIIRSPKNGGYGYGHNKAIRESESEIHYVINPDVKFGSSILNEITQYMEKNQDVILATPRLNDEEGRLMFPPKREPRLRYLISRFLPYKGIAKKYCDEYTEKEKTSTSTAPFEIEICSGCFMAMRRNKIVQLHGFDENFFMYFEDFDLSHRARRIGKIMYLPDISIIHEGKREGHRSEIARKYLIDSMKKYFNKWGWKF